jgi:uncharacterized membrane protein
MSAASATTIGAGIVGLTMVTGLFWGWAFSAMPGLRSVDDRTYVASMQPINRAILNPMFLVAFTGTVVVLAVAALTTFLAGDTRRAWWITAAAVTYTVGVFGVTVAGNVPLNDALDAFAPAGADDAGFAAARRAYEGPWNRLHVIRSALGVLAVVFAATAALTPTED